MKNRIIRDSFEFEFKRKELLSAKVSTPLAIWIFEGSVFGYFVNNLIFDFSIIGILNYIFIGLFGSSLAVPLFLIFRILYGPDYEAVARAPELLDWKTKLKEHFEGDLKKVDQEIYQKMEVRMAESAANNAQKNDNLDKSYSKLYQLLAICALMAFLTSIFHFTLKIKQEYTKYNEQQKTCINASTTSAEKCNDQDGH